MEKTYDSVFDIANDADLEFDAIFDEDDELADTIEGVNEDGKSLIYEEDEFAELHQTDDDATPDDLRDELGPDHDEDFGAKDAEGTVGYDFENKPEIGKKDDQSTVDVKDVKNEEDPDYQDSDDSTKGVEDTVSSRINGSVSTDRIISKFKANGIIKED